MLREVFMHGRLKTLGNLCLSVCLVAFASTAFTQDDDPAASATMRPVIRGRQAAVSSMKPEATDVARRILQAGGNAFDAAVGG